MVRSDIKRTFNAFNMKELVPSHVLIQLDNAESCNQLNNVFKKIASIN